MGMLKVCPEVRGVYDQPESHFSLLGRQLYEPNVALEWLELFLPPEEILADLSARKLKIEEDFLGCA